MSGTDRPNRPAEEEADTLAVASPTADTLVGADSGGDTGPSAVIRPPVVAATRAIVDRSRYQIREELARGGMGRISIADDRALGRLVAIKEILREAPDIVARFERELALTARLQHPGIVTVHDGGQWPDGHLVYVMRLVSGESLEARIGRCATFEDRMELLPNVIAAVDALAYAHSQGVIHRDLKPANILIGDFGETVVIDWGLAKELGAPGIEPRSETIGGSSASGETEVGDVIGTPAYMPPEQASGGSVDERADVYALGAVLYHLLAGRAPYPGRSNEVIAAVLSGPPPPLARVAPGLPPDLLAIVARAMETEPSARYPSASALRTELKRFQNGQLVGAHRYSAWELIRRWVRKRRATVAVVSVAAVMLAAGAVISVRRIVSEEARTHAALDLAERHRTDAEERGADAERLIDFMLFQLHDKLEPIGRLDLLNDVALTMQAHYQHHGGALTARDQHQRARARQNLGNVLFQKGDAPEHSSSMKPRLPAWPSSPPAHRRTPSSRASTWRSPRSRRRRASSAKPRSRSRARRRSASGFRPSIQEWSRGAGW